MMGGLNKSRNSHDKTGEGGRALKHERSIDAERRRGEGKNAGRKTGLPKAVNQNGEISQESRLDTLREDRGIIRKQASSDGGVPWKIVCVNVVQVRRKHRSLRDPREARSRVRI
ncbi:hypothetical protein TNCV_2893141 [Trichonephila clavipes]|nr:hypothetical protein TNCV_2893141 [Trichonephila clavipes]